MSIFPMGSRRDTRAETKTPPYLKREVKGLLLVTLGLLVFLSVTSFSPNDRPLFLTLSDSSVAPSLSSTENLIGRVGATIAFGLFWLIGGAAHLVPLLIVLFGIRAFLDANLGGMIRSLVGSLLAVVCLSALMQFRLSSIPTAGDLIVAPGMAGGMSGQWTAQVLEQYFASLGSHILLSAGLLVSVLLVTPFSLVNAARQIPRWWGAGKAAAHAITPRFFVDGERGKKVKANKPVKINRTLHVRGGVSAGPKKKEADTREAVTPEIGDVAPVKGSVPTTDEGDQSTPSLEFMGKVSEGYRLPDPTELLSPSSASDNRQTDELLETHSRVLTRTLQSFGIEGKVTEVHPGPVITMYEFEPAPGIKVARIVNLADDLAMALKATNVRIVAPLPGKSTVGIEVPNPARETVSLRDILTSEVYVRSRSKLNLALGKDIFGRPVVANLRSMPHLLVAGSTGSGKSVGLNSMLLSILFSAHPNEVKLLLIDPKVLELQVYDGIPHLLRPVITDPKSATRGLTWVVQEMERRYRLLAEHGVRNIDAFNYKVAQKQGTVEPDSKSDFPEQMAMDFLTEEERLSVGESMGQEAGAPPATPPAPLPYILVVIDEFADLMMVATKEVEDRIARLAQMARASGIHLILATQRPSVDVVTGLIKANFPARIAYQVSSKIDSRTILDANGAEALLGLGDMLYMASGTGRITRLHGSFVSDEDVRQVVEFMRKQTSPSPSESGPAPSDIHIHLEDEQDRDETYEQAKDLVINSGQASASLIQRRLRVGYPRAARMIEQMEEEGIVSPPGRDGRREVLARRVAIIDEGAE